MRGGRAGEGEEAHLVVGLFLPGRNSCRLVLEPNRRGHQDLRRSVDLGENELRFETGGSNYIFSVGSMKRDDGRVICRRREKKTGAREEGVWSATRRRKRRRRRARGKWIEERTTEIVGFESIFGERDGSCERKRS